MSKQVLPPFGAVIFDLDGLVLDTESGYRAAWRQAAEALGQSFDDAFYLDLCGRHSADVEAAFSANWLGRFDRGAFFSAAERAWRTSLDQQGIPVFPGVAPLLAWLRQRDLAFALATNSEARYAAECLRRAGIDGWFNIAVTRDQVASGKPAPDVFIEAARRLGVACRDCLVLEDSETGLRAARAAGAIPLLIQADARRRENWGCLADRSYVSLAELLSDFRMSN